jgi:uncharacterized protein (UPF0218 family)
MKAIASPCRKRSQASGNVAMRIYLYVTIRDGQIPDNFCEVGDLATRNFIREGLSPWNLQAAPL